jgi:hypothetical protein
MSSFTENLYLKRAIQKLQEENQQLLKILNEVDINAGITPPTVTPPPAPRPFPVPTRPSIPRPFPRPTNTSVTQRSVSQGGSPPTPTYGSDDMESRRTKPGYGISPPTTPDRGTWFDPMYGAGGLGVPMQTPYPLTMPFPVKTPAPLTMPYQQPFSLNRPYDPNDDPNNFRPVKYGGGFGEP